MQNSTGWVLYVLFALVLLGMYLAIRRRVSSPGVTAGVGTLTSIVVMILISLAQGNAIIHALVVGIFVGGAFSGATLAMAWYFHTNETRTQGGAPAAHTPSAESGSVPTSVPSQPVAVQDDDY